MKGSPIFTDLSLAAKTDRLANSISKSDASPKTPLLTKEGWTAFRRTGWFFPQFSLRLCVIFLSFTRSICPSSRSKRRNRFTPGDDRKLASWRRPPIILKSLPRPVTAFSFTRSANQRWAGRSSCRYQLMENIKSLEKYKTLTMSLPIRARSKAETRPVGRVSRNKMRQQNDWFRKAKPSS